MAIYQFGFLGIKYWSGDTYISAINQSGQQSGVRRGGKTGMDKTERGERESTRFLLGNKIWLARPGKATCFS